VTTTTARMNGTLISLGTADNVTVGFVGGTTAGGPYDAPVGTQVLDAPGPFYFDASGLTPGTTYYYRAMADGDGDPVYGEEKSSTTLTTAPTVTTGAATPVVTTSATLNGDLTLLGTAASVTVSFVWGTADGGPYTSETTGQVKDAIGAFTADLSGLTPGTVYYYKAKAVGADTVYGDQQSFTTAVTQPTVATTAASSPATTSATLNGNLSSLGTATSVNVSFEWGTTTSYGSETTAQSVTAIGAFSANLTGLTANTTYHFRAKAAGHGSAVYGADMTFSTADATAPTISAVNSTEITKTGATITWSTNEAATSRVEYGLTEEYGSFTTLDTNLVTNHSVQLTGLKAGKTYHYRVISEDASNNEAVSADNTLKTSASSGGMPVWAWVLIGLAVVGVVGGAAFLLKGRMAQG
jgi:phosphodiesterase/alkaline phosphatase D-like protein